MKTFGLLVTVIFITTIAPVVSASNATAAVSSGTRSGSLSPTSEAISLTTPITKPAPVQVEIGTVTLIAGGPDVMISGTILSLDASGSSIVIGGSTTQDVAAYLSSQGLTFSPKTGITTSSMGIGGIIASLGGFATPTSSPSPTASPTSTASTHYTHSLEPTSTSTTATEPVSISCGGDLVVCQVEDPDRLEAPWHGVFAPFPQCYDPALYNCSENFLCPIDAAKVPGEYACKQ